MGNTGLVSFDAAKGGIVLFVDRLPGWWAERRQDVTFVGFADMGLPDGAYRPVDRRLLGWMAGRIEAAMKSPKADSESLSKAIQLFHAARDGTGLEPCDPGEVPAGYGKPVRTADEFAAVLGIGGAT